MGGMVLYTVGKVVVVLGIYAGNMVDGNNYIIIFQLILNK